MQRRVVIRVAAVIAVAFGAATIWSGGKVLFGSGAAAAGRIVPFVVWFNFLAGFAYVAAGVGLWLKRVWAARLAAALAIATLLVFGAFVAHIAMGGPFEPRTVGAMTLRSFFWLGVATLACASLGCVRRRAACARC
jgi:hypothetical protein